MTKGIDDLLKENQKLIQDKEELYKKLTEANEIIEAIKKGNIDAVFSANDETAKVLVSKTADQAYRKFIENMSEGVITLHTDGVIVYCNSSFAKIVNLPLEKVMGTNVRDFIPFEYIEDFNRFFKEDRNNNSKLELSILNSKELRAHFIISLNIVQLFDSVALNLVWTDVTYQKEAEEKVITVNDNLKIAIEDLKYSETKVNVLNNRLKENIKILEDANIELATFAHIASHDLQEPLRKIITFSSMLMSEYYESIDQRGQNYINNMQRASTRMRNLINDILEYSQVSNKEFLFKSTNLQTIVKEIISNLEIVILETKAKITIENELPVIEANPAQMRQLFQNLISNSLKFIMADRIPEINISFEIINGIDIEKTDESMLDEKYYRFYIKDNGIGFKQQYMSKIFTIFQRLHSNSVYQGTGIGLAICKKIVEKHDGFITAESELNEGSLFTITLPASHVIRLKQKQKNDHKYGQIANSE